MERRDFISSALIAGLATFAPTVAASDEVVGTRFCFAFPFDDTGEFDEAVYKAMHSMLDTYKIVNFSISPPRLSCFTGEDGVTRKGFWIGATAEADSEGDPVMRQQSDTRKEGENE